MFNLAIYQTVTEITLKFCLHCHVAHFLLQLADVIPYAVGGELDL